MMARLALVLASLPVTAAVFGKDTYAMTHPFAWKDFMETYFPTMEFIVQANSSTTCNEWVKLCIDDGHTTSCNGPSGNFQMHAVGAYARDSGEKSMEQLELEFTQAMGDLQTYDPYFDYHLAFLTEDLDAYIAAFDAGNVAYFASTFTDPNTNTEYKSVLLQTPGSLAAGAKSLVNIELLGPSSTLLGTSVHRHELPRASSDALAVAAAHLAAAPRRISSDGKPVLAKIHRSFATSNLARDVKYFEEVLQGSKDSEETVSTGSVYTGKMLSGDAVSFRYVESSSASQGPQSVAAWEAYQVDLHGKCFVSEKNDGFDRLADNHWGHELGGVALDAYIKGQQAAGLPYRFYGGLPGGRAVFLYIYGANGWGCQVIGRCQDASLCPSTDPGGYNMCTQGIKGHCNNDESADFAVAV